MHDLRSNSSALTDNDVMTFQLVNHRSMRDELKLNTGSRLLGRIRCFENFNSTKSSDRTIEIKTQIKEEIKQIKRLTAVLAFLS